MNPDVAALIRATAATPLIGSYIRDTYSVRVVIRHDTRSWRGYRVRTAFPVND